ncbi:MAG: 3-hydroxyacyl-CoA dehydrogenase family protein [Bacillota bacterium]|nr:3-hydroxyacyl-CoA dehydrogenase family protein [Bacillota bacterium]
MKLNEINKICVVGAGNMGHQISMLAALNGYKVGCIDSSREQLDKAEEFADTYLPGRISKGKLTEEEASRVRANLVFTQDIEAGAAEADFAVEAVTEVLEVKKNIFRQLDRIMPSKAIITTNSSFFVSSLLAGETKRPDKVCNMHFFNPALVMKCVEVVKGPHTAEETAVLTMELAKCLGKVPVLLKKEIYGFLVNRILAAINNEALYLLETEVASAEDIDSAVTNALGHPLGPFSLMDLTGIDLSYHITMERYRETGDAVDKPSPTIVEKFVKGEWGKKTGTGFYRYTE